MHGGFGPWMPHEKIYVGFRAPIKTTSGIVASTKQLITGKCALKVGEQAGSLKLF